MGKAPAFQMFAADFYMDTTSWTSSQVGAYVRLLMSSWVNGGLSPKIGDLARIAGVDPRNMQKMWSTVIAKKWYTDDAGMLRNKRLEEERESQAKHREIQMQKGLSGAKKRWKDHIAPAIAQVMPDDSSSSSSSSSLKDKRIKNKHIAKPSVSPDVKSFIDFYYSSFKEKFGNPPIIEGGKDGSIVKSLLKNIPLNELQNLLAKMFDSDDPFVQKSGYTLGVFKSQINKLRIGNQKHSGLKAWANEIMEEEDDSRQEAVFGVVGVDGGSVQGRDKQG